MEHAHTHDASHGHHHHHHHHTIQKLSTIYIVAVALNLLFVIIEAVAGLVGHSLGLLSDAGHNLSDVFSLLLAMIALKLAASMPTKRFTYGHRKTSILISLLNAIILLVAVGAIIVESIQKIIHPSPVNGTLVIWTAAVGILINGLTAWALSRQQQHDINTRGAFLHMLADTLEHFTCHRRPKRGEQVRSSVCFAFSFGSMTLAQGVSYVGDELIAEIELKIFMQS